MESTASPAPNRTRLRKTPRRGFSAARQLFGGGVEGNEELTAIAGVILILLFAVLGVTIVRIGQLIWLHLFLGLLLLGPVLLKMASAGYRFARYYLGSAVYLAKGPPALALRAMGPVLVLLTVVVFGTGIWLLFDGPRNRATPLLIHKVSFIVWLVLFGLHILAHLPGLARSLRAVRMDSIDSGLGGQGSAGSAGRWIAIAGGLVGGAVLAVALIPHFSLWTAPGALPHHHHH